MATEAGGMHSTGMHSCYLRFQLNENHIQTNSKLMWMGYQQKEKTLMENASDALVLV